MCVCRPEVRTPFCGRIGCEWPKPAGTRAESKSTEDTEQPAPNTADPIPTADKQPTSRSLIS